mmetsp:Transcript_32609/g.24090  ORF Transcript_32609/g.24090 Transcript_32609/m.24090 type:complete len:197 (+) Transcript_32609:458-1048(+)|eukprot:CAMPEP_0202978896 /NCGR_PEP_ID=MMETSP1396-20130829/85193_1 /ASSEMBLY_ACC=CAM_ASM_000872 /TAXON_ID= /ORGANISM="Pseudokeronopsis sp., Strain Brazil" /LENGTH=196 /DNA_ID=CAMNT_0049718069 /DNA_START=454 /DNA_END=1044 /DNA_ORIENTATION=-
MERGVSRIPLKFARMYEEDVLEAMDDEGHKALLNQTPEILEDYLFEEEKEVPETIKVRTVVEEDDDVFSKERSSTIYSNHSGSLHAQLEDFKVISIIGRGSFGKVYLVQSKVEERLFAMKSIRKDLVLERDSLENLRLEKLILLQVNHPFIIQMEHVFQKAFHVYFLMDYIPGGELFKYLAKYRRFSEEVVRFYAA